ncbi:hypothetical protein CF386_04780 [Paraphotobacterium marinum]|uniref:Porin domain-containing protein n=1 Tax=Paraphotobacterium marinum TaxID=1755811 RepID=A0A220VDE9_9GAMM|nr:porin [Paraphotobacterium marinum]ASK78369.1 hypothetical protein CF386_04780 [Paraphotobacterium marinum]
MKKTLLAVALTAVTAGTAHAATVYDQDGTSLQIGGFVEARAEMEKNPTSFDSNDYSYPTTNSMSNVNDESRFRLNMTGKSMINDTLYGIGFAELEFDVGSSNVDTRYVYAGIGGDFGQVTYGKQDGALDVITDFTDIMPNNGATASNKITSADRVANTLAYAGTFGDISTRVTYKAKQSDVDTVGQGFGGSLVWNLGDSGFSAGAGYAYERDNLAGNAAGTVIDRASTYNTMLGLSYNDEMLYVGLLGSVGKHLTTGTFVGDDNAGFANNNENVDVTVSNVTNFGQQQVGAAKYWGAEFATAVTLDQWILQATYNYGKYTDLDNAGSYLSGVAAKTGDNDPVSANNADFAVNYVWNKQFTTYVEYQADFLDKKDQYYRGDNAWLGAMYSF